MDSRLITTIIFTIVGSGIIAPFSKSIFDKIFAAYNPDPKKINSGIKKSLVFIFRYILPVAFLIFWYNTYNVVDKLFLFISSFIFSCLFFNIAFDLIIYSRKKITDNNFKVATDLINLNNKMVDKLQELSNDINTVGKLSINSTELTNKIANHIIDKEKQQVT